MIYFLIDIQLIEATFETEQIFVAVGLPRPLQLVRLETRLLLESGLLSFTLCSANKSFPIVSLHQIDCQICNCALSAGSRRSPGGVPPEKRPQGS
jgi:hypothetical protein